MRQSDFQREARGSAVTRIRPVGRRALLTTTALIASGLAMALLARPASAQQVSVYGTEIVDGGGLGVGTPPSTKPAEWNVGSDWLYVGLNEEEGELIIRNGGRVLGSYTTIAAGSAAVGEVVVTGTGSALTIVSGRLLYIGDAGMGRLAIADGGAVTSGRLLVGLNNGVGEIAVTGTGSRLATSGQFLLGGDGGTAVLTVADGATVANSRVDLGGSLLSTGRAVVTGAGSTWSAAYFNAGLQGNGALTLATGGALNTSLLTIAAQDGSTGIVNIGAAAGDAAVAPGSLSATTIDFGTGTGSIVFNHTGEDFALDADINGAGTLRLLAGRTTLSGDNTYTGSTVLEGGALVLGSSTALGGSTLTTRGSVVSYADGVTIASPIVIDSDTTQFEVLTGSATQSGVISQINGARPFEKIGGGELVLTADNTWTGQTRVNGGTLTIAEAGSVAGGSGRIGEVAGATGAVTVTGRNSIWTNGSLFVGESGTGALTIADGGAVITARVGYIGDAEDAIGEAVVTGPYSNWSIAEVLYVGLYGEGRLTIADGGDVYNLQSFIGSEAGSLGAVTVTGANSIWTNEADLTIGGNGDGTLSVADGAVFYSENARIGRGVGSNGAVTVTGTGSTWSNREGIQVGYAGAGALTIADGGSVSTLAGVFLGYEVDSVGRVLVTGADSVWTSTSNIVVGRKGDGAFAIEAGGAVTTARTVIGDWVGASGSMSLTGVGSSLAAGSDILVGDEGSGVLRVADGAVVSSQQGSLGSAEGASGTVTVTGAGSSWTNTGRLTVGDRGTGVLTIADGASMSNAEVFIGSVADSVGRVTVNGTNSLWTTNAPLYVGFEGDGGLTIQAGGEVSSGQSFIAVEAGSVGSVLATGADSLWASNSDIYIGNSGTGALSIANGATVSNSNGVIARDPGSAGTVTVTGAGSVWSNQRTILVGESGDASLSISAGGQVAGQDSWIGEQVGSTGTVSVTGPGSGWANTGGLVVGGRGAGTLTVAGGGTASSQVGLVGYEAGSTGSVSVTGAGSLWQNASALVVGAYGTGNLAVADGGGVTVADAQVGYLRGGEGAVAVTGAGSTLTSNGLFTVGGFGDGALTLSNGGVVGASSVVLAASFGGTGVLNIGAAAGDAAQAAGRLESATLTFGEGAGTLVFNHTASILDGGYAFAAGLVSDAASDARVRTLSGATRLTGTSTGYQGGLSVEGGVLSVDGVLGSGDVTATVAGGGTLTGTGVLNGDLTILSGGILAGESVRTLGIGGNLTLLNGAAVNATLGAPGGSELFAVGGDLTLDGVLNVTDGGGFGPGLYSLFTYGGSLTDNGLALGSTPSVLLPGELDVQTSVAGQVNLVSRIGVDLTFWDGDAPASLANGAIDGGDGTWSASSLTFTDIDGLVNGPARPSPAFVVFTGAPGAVSVDDGAGQVAIAGAQFAVDGYVITGDGIALDGNGVGEAILRVGDGTQAGAGMTATVASSLTGAGGLVKTDLGTLVLTGANSYGGGTIVRGGTLVGNTASIAGTVVNDATLVFDQATDASFAGAISGDGVTVKRGTGVLSLAGINQTDWSVAGGGLSVGAAAFTGDVAIGAGAGLVYTTANDTAWGGVLTGAGTFAKAGAATLRLTGDSSSFLGGTTVTGGGLRVDGTLGGDVAVSGGSLSGTGSVLGAVNLGAARLTGVQGQTLTVGSLALSAASSLDVTLGSASSAALFDVGGALTLDGVLNVTDAGGFGAGVYRLFDYGGTLSDNGLEIGTRPPGVAADNLFVQTATAGRVNLVSSTGVDLRFWDGSGPADDGVLQGGSGTWSLAGRAWSGANGAVNGAYDNPAFAVFAGAGGTVTVAGTGIGVTGMQFAANGYSVTGDAIALTAAETLIRVGDGTQAGAGMTATIASVLTGSGGLVKTDLGTLVLTGANSYAGGTIVRGGTLVGNAASIAGTVVNDAILVFDQATDASFAGAISGDGVTVKRGTGVLSLTGVNQREWTVQSGGLLAQAGRFTGDVGIASGANFTLDASAGSVFSGVLSGNGTFTKTGARELVLTGNSAAFAGTTEIRQGLLLLNGSLGGELRIAEDGMLGGSGTLARLRAGDGAVISPGNSIGTLNITGDVRFETGSLYEVEVDPATDASDRIVAGGIAALAGGTVRHIGLTGAYRPSSTYTILTAAGGVTGTFAAIETDFAFLDASLAYQTNAVLMTLERNAIPFPAVGETRNQRAAAAAVEATGTGTALYDAVVGLDAGNARFAFDGLSGELHGSIRTVQSEAAQVLAGALSRRMVAARYEVAEPAFWAQATGSRARLGSDGNAASLTRSTGGVMIGADTGVGAARLGLAAQASTHEYDSPSRSGQAEGESYSLAIYGSSQWRALEFSGAVSGTWHTVESERRVTFPGFAESLDADYDARTVHAFVEAAWRVETGAGTTVAPFLNLARVRTKTDGFTETGGDAALAVQGRVQAANLATVGIGFARVHDQGNGRSANLSARLGWRQAWGDTGGDGHQAFAGGPAFTVRGLPLAEEAVVAELGLEVALKDRLSLTVDWLGQQGADLDAHALAASLSWRF